jgi:hypothetical protein
MANSRQTPVPKITRNLREFVRVLARRGVRVAKISDGYQDRQTRRGEETPAIAAIQRSSVASSVAVSQVA